MNETRERQQRRSAPEPTQIGRRRRCWHWQAVVVALLALIAVQGEPAVATHATTGQTPRAAELARRQATSPVRSEASVNAARPTEDSVRSVAPDDRPDFRLTFAALDDAQAGQPFSYTIQVRNDGNAAGVASVSAVVPPELTNVRVNAPGFVCTRRFAASGPQVGTLVACMRNDLESGASADVTIEANAPSAAGRYYLSAVADPRDEVGETDEANNQADVTVQVDG